MSLTVIATFDVTEGRREELLELLAQCVPQVLQEDGCQGYEPHTVGRDQVVVIERWESPERFKAHASSAALASFTDAAAGLLARDVRVVVARPVDVARNVENGRS